MNISFSLLSLLVFTIPLSIVTGPFLPDLSIIFAILLYFYLVFKKEMKIKFNLYLIISLMFFSLIILSFAISFSENTISGGYLFYLRFSLLGLIIFSLIKHDELVLKKLYFFLTCLLFIICCDAIFQYFIGFNFIGYEDLVENRISGFFKTEYILGKYLFFTFVVYIYLYIKINSKLRYFFYLNFFLISFALILSGERTSIILFLMFITLFSLLYDKISIFKKFLLIIFIPLIIFAVIKSNPSYFDRFYPGFEISFDIFSDPSQLINMSNVYFYNNFMYYIDFFKVSLAIFNENIFFGVGPKMYRVECLDYIINYSYACSTHPHNTYLQLLSETGIFTTIIVFLLWLLTFFLIIKQFIFMFIFKKSYLNKNLVIFVIAYFVMLFPFLPNNSFFNNNSSILLYFPLGFFLYEISQSQFNNKIFLKNKIIE